MSPGTPLVSASSTLLPEFLVLASYHGGIHISGFNKLAEAGNAAVRPTGGRVYWKTTTMGLGNKKPVLDTFARKVLPQAGWGLYDAHKLTMPASKNPSLYWEDLHFHCKVHNMLNEELVKLISPRLDDTATARGAIADDCAEC